MIERDWLSARYGRRYSKRDIVSHWLHRRTILVCESNLTFLFKSFVTFFLPTIRRYPILSGHNKTWPNKGRGRRKRGTRERERDAVNKGNRFCFKRRDSSFRIRSGCSRLLRPALVYLGYTTAFWTAREKKECGWVHASLVCVATML